MLDEESVWSTLRAIYDGTAKPRHSENLFERIAGVSDYLVAVETYRAAVKRWADAKITLRNRARVIEQSWRD